MIMKVSCSQRCNNSVKLVGLRHLEHINRFSGKHNIHMKVKEDNHLVLEHVAYQARSISSPQEAYKFIVNYLVQRYKRLALFVLPDKAFLF